MTRCRIVVRLSLCAVLLSCASSCAGPKKAAPADAPSADATAEAPTSAPADEPTTSLTEEPTSAPSEVLAPTTAEAPSTAPAEVATTVPTEAPAPAPTEPPAPTEAAPVPAPPAVPDVPNAALAERLATAAQETLRTPGAGEHAWRAGAALLRAASRLAPTEPRFARLYAEALGRIGDDQATVEALSAYRRLAPTDESAQIEQIDLFLSRMETSDAKASYLSAVSAAEDVPGPVRAHAALRRAQVLEERSERTASDEGLEEALKYDPLNLDALEIKYKRLPADAPPEQRVAGLLALMRSNPAQAALASVLARELASVGLAKASVQWYGTAFGLYQNNGIAPSSAEVIDYAAEAYIAGEAKLAEGLLAQFLAVDPDHVEGWLLRLIVARSSADKEAAERIRKQTATAIANRLAVLRKEGGEADATTQPIDPPSDAPWPDANATLEKLRAGSTATTRPELIEAFAATALSAAWFKIYFEEKAEEAQPWINALRTLLVDDSQTVARLEGWTFLLQNKPDEARVKLSAAADRDPLAALGLIRLAGKDPAAKATADADAQALLARHGFGLTGATLADALAFRGIRPGPSDDAEAVTLELAKFPGQLMRILDYPGAFYSLRAEPVRISHGYGDAMLLKVTIQNLSEYDLTIGPDGIVRGDLWIDAQLRGIVNEQFPGVAFDRLAGPIVLPAKKSMTQVVRANQGAVAQYLADNPTASHQVAFSVTTNPTSAGADGAVAPGPAGQRVTSSRLVERRGTPNNAPVIAQRAADAMANGQPAEKVQQLELVTTFAQRFQSDAATAADEKAKAGLIGLLDVIGRGSADEDPNVRAWALYCDGVLGTDEERAASVEAMSGDPAWTARLLAVRMSQTTGKGRDTVARLAKSDPDETIKQYAAAVAAMPATTQPATTQSATAQSATAPTP